MYLVASHYDEQTKIWSGPKEELYYHYDCSIGKIIFNAMKNFPNKVIQICDTDNVALTNGQFITLAIRIAQHFKNLDLCHDDVVGITANNSTFVSPIALACLLNCTPFHAVNPIHDEKTLTHVFGITKPKVIFCAGKDYEKIRLATKMFRPKIYTIANHIRGVLSIEDLLAPTNTEYFYKPEELLHGGDQTMAIVCSSGTTGMPKGVCLSNHTLINAYATYITSEDIVYTASGIDWLSGIVMMLISCLQGCTRIISNKSFSAWHFIYLIRKYKVTYTFLPPRAVNAVIRCTAATTENLTSLRLISTGGGIISLTSLQALQRTAKNAFINFRYGMTEMGNVATNIGLDKGTSCGKVNCGVRVRIVDDYGRNLGPNKIGEIYVNQQKKWKGYYGNLMETQCVLDSQEWYHTGDLGYFDEDHYLYVIDRKKEILKYQGIHYWPGEIELCIAELSNVKDVCVIGVYDERQGDLAGALVVKLEGSPLCEADIKDYVKKKLIMVHKQLNAGVMFLEKLPQTKNGKLLRRDAKAIFLAAIEKIKQ